MEPAEFILKIMIIATLSIGIFGLIIQDSLFRGSLDVAGYKRIGNTLAQATLAAPCLTEEIDGELRKGVFEVEKIEAVVKDVADGYIDFCVDSPISFLIIIKSGVDEWSIGDDTLVSSHYVKVPVAVKKSDTEIVPGSATVYVEEV